MRINDRLLTFFSRVTLLFLVASLFASDTDAQTWAQQATLAADIAFVERVKMSMVSRAVLIVQTETDTDPVTLARRALARQVVSNPTSWAAQFAVATAADTSIRSTSTDAEINARVASVWNTFAGS